MVFRVTIWNGDSGRNVAVTQPLLNFFQAYTVCVQQACTAMPQIMKANLPHTVLLQDQREMLRDIAGFHKLTDFIDIDIVGVLGAVRPSAQLAVLLLLCFQTVQQFFKRWDKRQTAVAGFRLCPILLDDLAFV